MLTARRNGLPIPALTLLGLPVSFSLYSLLDSDSYTLPFFASLLVAVGFAVSLLFPPRRKGPLLAAALMTCVLLVEELMLSGGYVYYGLLVALSAMMLFPIAGAFVRKDEAFNFVLQVSGLIFASRVVYASFSERLLNVSVVLPSLYVLIVLACVLFLLAKST